MVLILLVLDKGYFGVFLVSPKDEKWCYKEFYPP